MHDHTCSAALRFHPRFPIATTTAIGVVGSRWRAVVVIEARAIAASGSPSYNAVMLEPTPRQLRAVQRLSDALLELMMAAFEPLERRLEQRQAVVIPAAVTPTAARGPVVEEDEATSPRLLSVREAARFLGVSTGTVSNHTAPKGSLKSIRIGALRRYAVTDLQEFIDKSRAKHG